MTSNRIIEAALRLARTRGYTNVTRDDIARLAGCSPALVSYHFGGMGGLRSALMRYAIENEELNIVAQGLVAGDKQARSAPDKLKQRAAASLLIGR